MVAPGTPTLGFQVSERELHGPFIYLSIYRERGKTQEWIHKQELKKKKNILEQVRYSKEEW